MSTQAEFIQKVLEERFKYVDPTLPTHKPVFMVAEFQVRKEVEASYASALELPLELEDMDIPYETLSRADLQKIFSHDLKIPIIPQVATFLKKLLDHPSPDTGMICSTLGMDPRLTASLLMLANKSRAGAPPIRTVSRAVAIIGARRSLLLAAGTVNQQTLPPDLDKRFNFQKYWFHCLACAFLCRKMGLRINPREGEAYFAAGLIHSIASLALVGSIPDIAEQILRYSSLKGVPIAEAERKIIGYDHGTLGSALFKKWGLPPDLIQGVKEHRSQSSTPLGAALLIADTLSKAFGFGTQTDYYVNDIHEEALRHFGLVQKSWSAFVSQSFRETRVFLTMVAARYNVEPPYPPVETW